MKRVIDAIKEWWIWNDTLIYMIMIIIGLILLIGGCHSCNKAMERKNFATTYILHITHWDRSEEDIVVEGKKEDTFQWYQGRDGNTSFIIQHWGNGEAISIWVKDFYIKSKTIHVKL